MVRCARSVPYLSVYGVHHFPSAFVSFSFSGSNFGSISSCACVCVWVRDASDGPKWDRLSDRIRCLQGVCFYAMRQIASFPVLLLIRSIECVCVCVCAVDASCQMKTFNCLLFYTTASLTKTNKTLAHTISRCRVVVFLFDCVFKTNIKIVYWRRWWCRSVASAGDNESPSHHLNKLALCHLLLSVHTVRSMQFLCHPIEYSMLSIYSDFPLP